MPHHPLKKAREERTSPSGYVDAAVASRLIAAAADLALVVDEAGVVRNVSTGSELSAESGYAALAGKSWVDTTTKESRIKVERLLKEALSGSVPLPREINQLVEGVGEVPFRFSAVLLSDREGVLALGRDLRAVARLQQQMVSAQQAMDREYARMRQAETRYRLLFQLTAECVLVVDAATLKVVESNPAAAALFDRSPHGLQGQSLPELFAPRSAAVIQSLVAATAAGGRPSDVEASLPGASTDKSAQVTISASPFRQSGTLLLLLRVRPAVEEKPQSRSRSRLLAAIEALPDGLVVVGEDRSILSANRAFCEMVGQADEYYVVGQPLDRWLGRPGVDLNIMLANLREHGSINHFATVLCSDYGPAQEAVVSAVATRDLSEPCYGFAIRRVPVRMAALSSSSTLQLPRSVEQLRDLVGRVSLKEIVRESADLIERLCIEAALKVSGENRASAAQLLGLSRQGFYLKLRRHGLRELDPSELV